MANEASSSEPKWTTKLNVNRFTRLCKTSKPKSSVQNTLRQNFNLLGWKQKKKKKKCQFLLSRLDTTMQFMLRKHIQMVKTISKD